MTATLRRASLSRDKLSDGGNYFLRPERYKLARGNRQSRRVLRSRAESNDRRSLVFSNFAYVPRATRHRWPRSYVCAPACVQWQDGVDTRSIVGNIRKFVRNFTGVALQLETTFLSVTMARANRLGQEQQTRGLTAVRDGTKRESSEWIRQRKREGERGATKEKKLRQFKGTTGRFG